MKTQLSSTGIFLYFCFSFHHPGIKGQTYFSSCESRGPRRYSEVPCDLQSTSYCTEPGLMYPRHAVRRFVSDNQGLMRRMYGDLRHLSVLRSEMEWNSVQEESNSVWKPGMELGRTSAKHLMNSTSAPPGHSLDNNVTKPTTKATSAAPTASTTTRTTQAHSTAPTPASTEKPTEDKGVNACPTKQEVVAPYWAVNTRGRTLAIVNDPPYEQHIHWEKCLNENEQMLCRDGCKCEQQFRLQRLLAFDPTCDCKGVFMDWFLLPSCCICKCYGISFNSTPTKNATSGNRQGRKMNKNMLENYEDDDQWLESANFTDPSTDEE